MFQVFPKWGRKAPVPFQVFNNVQYGNIPQGTYYSGVLTGNVKNIWYTNKILSKLQEKASEIIYPNVHHSEKCTIMIVSNLAEPDWMQISCQEKLSLNVLCTERKMKQAVHQQNFEKAKDEFCQTGSFSLRGDCYLLSWYQNSSNVCYIWVFLGFLEIVPEEQRTVGSVMLQFI